MKMWDDFLGKIEEEFNSNKEGFLRQSLIKQTIACVSDKLCDNIASKIDTENFIGESRVGRPILYNNFTLASYQHHWYLHLIEKHIRPINAFDSIVEIGAGYGNMRRIIGTRCTDYSIVDFPIMHEIQRYFLENNNVDNTNLISQNEIEGADLLLAAHSICEIPLEERGFIPWHKFKSVFVYFHPDAFGIENDKYFNEIAEEYNGKIFIDEVRPGKKYLVI